MGENTVNFNSVSDMLERISKTKKAAVKRKTFRTFLDHFYRDREYFSVMRLILPELDRERGNYGLKESVLAKCLADALGLAKGSQDAEKLLNWRKGGAQAGKNAGNFALIAAEIVGSRQSSSSGNLKVKRVNDLLNQLVEVKSREEKSKVLAELISKTNAVEMKWLIMIILKDLKLGISEKTIFKEFHPDADEVYNKTCDLKLVCEKLVDPNIRFKRQDIEVGKAVRPQLACRVRDSEEAWKKLRGKRVIAECKFDGDRCQVHKDGSTINFFSRSSIDHKEFADAMGGVISENILATKCILDGEIVVWNRVTNKFAEFGTIQEVAKHARDGIESDEQLCYIVFDVLYMEDCSVMHQPLFERQRLICQKVKPVSGRLEILQPDRRNSGGNLWSITPQSAGDLEQFFQLTIGNREEGIVVKDLDSKWEPGDRSGKWLKLKPDYVHPETDLDVLIIGGYYGSGRRGGEVAQFLLGLAERPAAGNPTRFHSFCKVGTGLSDDESKILVDKLRPYFRRYEKNGKPPSFYSVTNNSKERPDVWVDQPDKSVILQITSDIRCIKSEVFATPYSLRFPRVHRVRYDKPWNECLDVQSLVTMVEKRNSGNTGEVNEERKKRKPEKAPKKKQERLPLLEAHLQQTDVSGVKKVSELFRGLVFFFINVSNSDKERFHKLVVEYGGRFSMNLNGEVTHVIAENRRGVLYSTAAKRGDVIHRSWLLDSVAEKELLPLRPKYMLHLSLITKEKFKETIDEFGDHFFVDVDEEDLKQLFGYMDSSPSVGEAEVLKYREKFGEENLFKECRLFFYHSARKLSDDQVVAELVLRRLEVEVKMRRGEVVEASPREATHAIVYWEGESEPGSFIPLEDQKLMRKLSLVSHKWLVEALEQGSVPPESDYDLKPVLLENTVSPQASPLKNDVEMSLAGSLNNNEEADDETEKPGGDIISETVNHDDLMMGTLLGSSGTVPPEEDVAFEPALRNGSPASSTLLLQRTCEFPETLMNPRSSRGFEEPTLKVPSAAVESEMDPLMMSFCLPALCKQASSVQPEIQETVINEEKPGKRREDEPVAEIMPVKKKAKLSYKDKIASFL